VLAERASLLVQDTQADEAFKARDSIVGQSIQSVMAVPLQTSDRVIGLINLDSRAFARPFTPGDLDLLTVLANVAAIRIEQQRLALVEQQERIISRDLEQAAEIQRRLLPVSPPSIEGFDVAGYNLPCRTVGGDYFDFFTYPDGRMSFVLGDVAGKGMPAALLMTALKGGVQVLLGEPPDDVPRLMGRLDRVVAANFPRNRFVTLFFGLLDPKSGEMTYCNAGHNPPLLVRAGGGKIERLPSCGTILGIFPDMGYDARICQFNAGDVLTLFSDGVTEETNPAGEEFGEQQLIDLLMNDGRTDSGAIVGGISRAVTAWAAGAPAADDITVVVVRRTT
jgi:serine phosphatase RsbU (regulator of sigma subunit)